MTREDVIGWLKFLQEEEHAKADSIVPCTNEIALGIAIAALKQPQIVRCKDCEYWQDNNGGYPNPECPWGKEETPDPDDFCSFGERKEDDGE